jgi:hypothetical protein
LNGSHEFFVIQGLDEKTRGTSLHHVTIPAHSFFRSSLFPALGNYHINRMRLTRRSS